ncbi:CU044_5270 family protein [Actinomadura sp. 9N215]|uniref:CU044_5270 family protein n=1 Tax=Actinomadura sp. 9N215 TaxID=3375150 RepID=UPI003796137C
MDELDALRLMRTGLALEEPPERLAQRIDWRDERDARDARDDGAKERPRRGLRLRLRPRVPLLTLAAATVAATVAIALVAAQDDEGPAPGPGGENGPRPGNVLLAAAVSAQKAPSGKYWHVKTVSGEVYAVGKSASKHYKVDSRQGNEMWTDRNGLRRTAHIELPDIPLTAADRRKWQAAGSPEWVDVPNPEGGGEAQLDMSASSTGRSPAPPSPDERFYAMTPRQIAELPTDPKALENALLGLKDYWRAVSKDGVGPEPMRALRGEERVRALTDVAGTLLSTAPAPPEVRAAVFRMLANQPGVRDEGQTTDPLGRRGTAVSLPLKTTTALGVYTAPKQLGTYRRQFILNPDTGTLLAIRDLVADPPRGSRKLPPGDDGQPRSLRAEDMPDRFHRSGELASYQAFAVTEWTNTEPPH